MKILDGMIEDWIRIKKWITEIKNFLFSLLLLSSLLISIIWFSSIAVINSVVILGLIFIIVLYSAIIGTYTYIWYIQKQLKEKEAKIENLEKNLRKAEDENLVLKTKIETIEQENKAKEQTAGTDQTEKFLNLLGAIAKIKEEPITEEKNIVTQNQ